VYTSNFLDGSIVGKGGAVYHKYGGVCLETQGFPNAVNTPAFPNSVLEPHGEYRHRTVYKFSVTECFDGNCWERKPKAL
jgi:aldose 1-epimerase